MTDVDARLLFLADLELYKTQRPFVYTPLEVLEEKVDTSPEALNTIELVSRDVVIRDIRGQESLFSLSETGFEIVTFKSTSSDFQSYIESPETRERYRIETENLLRSHFEAEEVVCYSVKMRHNGEWDPTELVDLSKYGYLEPPAKGVHVDFTFEHAPSIILEQLESAGMHKYLVPGYRYRVVNTWRPLLPVLEDNPLAFCDSRSVDPGDLVFCDRILPNEYWTLYFVKYNPNQCWHWLSNQTQEEITIMLMYDTKSGGARYCCHSPFVSPLTPEGAQYRRSVETRSVIITKM